MALIVTGQGGIRLYSKQRETKEMYPCKHKIVRSSYFISLIVSSTNITFAPSNLATYYILFVGMGVYSNPSKFERDGILIYHEI